MGVSWNSERRPGLTVSAAGWGAWGEPVLGRRRAGVGGHHPAALDLGMTFLTPPTLRAVHQRGWWAGGRGRRTSWCWRQSSGPAPRGRSVVRVNGEPEYVRRACDARWSCSGSTTSTCTTSTRWTGRCRSRTPGGDGRAGRGRDRSGTWDLRGAPGRCGGPCRAPGRAGSTSGRCFLATSRRGAGDPARAGDRGVASARSGGASCRGGSRPRTSRGRLPAQPPAVHRENFDATWIGGGVRELRPKGHPEPAGDRLGAGPGHDVVPTPGPSAAATWENAGALESS